MERKLVMAFELKNPLSEEQWQSVERAAFKILKTTGMLVPHDPTLDALSGKKGITIDGQKVRFDADSLNDTIRTVKGTEAYDTEVIVGAYSHDFLDPDTNEVRTATLKDLVFSCRQADAFGAGVCSPVVPLDIPGALQEIVMERVVHENCRFSYGAGQATTAAAAEAQIEMSAVVNRAHELEVWVTSPLILDPTGLDILFKLRHRRPAVRLCNVPVRGMSSPISLAGTLAQSTAECLGTATVLRLLNIASPVTYRVDAFWSFAMDMRTGNVLTNGPDYLRLMVLSINLAKRYGIKSPMAKAMLTSSKQPDAQAAAEKAAAMLAAAYAGAGTCVAIGALSTAEIHSPIQVMIDMEIFSWVKACAKPVDFSEDDFLLDVIDRVGPNGSFIGEDSTVSRFREVNWSPNLFSMNSYPAWLTEGKAGLVEKAREQLKSLKMADGPVVSKEQQRELARIEKRFAAKL
jgi:trimethylamine---corrinoid protein Co-methyltransferase